MEMYQVRYFLALCEEQNFTRAAKRRGVSQPSLTNAIKRLEDEFGGALFIRAKSKTILTKLGMLMKSRIKKINREAELAHEIARLYAKRVANLNTLSAQNTSPPPQLLSQLANAGSQKQQMAPDS